MKLILVSTFWNAGNHVRNSINSIKNQYYTNFVSYFIDDMSTDNSYEIAEKTIDNDERFILIKNTEKKYKTKNFVDVIRNNPKIEWDDVIIEIDGDDQLSDKFVLGRINKVFMNENIWLCGTMWKDKNGALGNYGKPNPEKARSTSWNFSHMRSFRAFLFRQIKDEHLKMNGEYFKGACDIGHAIPMLEMSGSEHFYYINEPLYTYTWHNQQSYSEKGGIGDKTTQSKTAGYIYRLPKYGKLLITETKYETYFNEKPIDEFEKKFEERKKDVDIVLGSILNLKNKKPETSVDYGKINEIISKKGVYNVNSSIKPVRQNTPKDRNELMNLKKGNVTEQMNKMFPGKPNRRGDASNIFGNTKKNR